MYIDHERLWACECGRLHPDAHSEALAGAVLPRGDVVPLPPDFFPPPPRYDGGVVGWRARAKQAWPRVWRALDVALRAAGPEAAVLAVRFERGEGGGAAGEFSTRWGRRWRRREPGVGRGAGGRRGCSAAR